eukprot:gene2542-4956_t
MGNCRLTRQTWFDPIVSETRVVRRILRYINCTTDKGLMFKPDGDMKLVYFVDAFHNCYSGGKCHYGYNISLIECSRLYLVKSSKFRINALSSTWSKYVRTCFATLDTAFLRTLVNHMTFTQSLPTLEHEVNMYHLTIKLQSILRDLFVRFENPESM